MPKLLAFAILLISNFSFGQWNWPVQVNTFVQGTSNNYLTYFCDQYNRMQVMVTLTDQNASTVPARLKVRLEGANWWVESKEVLSGIPSLQIIPFQTEIITGIDLQPYFNEINLNKSSANLDLNNLPEGNIDVCVEVIGIGGTLTTIGGVQCGFTQMLKLEPPQLMFPVCEDVLDTNILFHNFTWSPPNNYFGAISGQLEFSLIVQEAIDPNNFAFNQNPSIGRIGPLPEIWTLANNFQINAYDYNLQIGKTYLWRVKARLIDGNGMERPNMFHNDGMSNFCAFVWGEEQSLEEQLTSDLIIHLNANSLTQFKGHASWNCENPDGQGLDAFSSYVLEYRLKPDAEHPDPNWHFDTLYSLNKDIYQLSPETSYEVRVSGVAGTYVSEPTDIVEFTTPAAVDYACGDQQIPFRPLQFEENENVKAGDQVQIGQFLMTLTEATPQSGPGHYKGRGWIPVDFLGGARANVRFDEILVDKEYVVRDGRVDVISDGIENWLYEELKDFVDPIYVHGTVDSVWVDTVSGVAWVTVDGVELEFVFDPPDYPIVIHDESGYSFTIWPNGTVEVGGYLDTSNDFLDVTQENTVQFQQNPNEEYGFDPMEHVDWHSNYEVLELSDSSFYFVANKSVGKDDSDQVDIVIPPGVVPTFKLNDQTNLVANSADSIYTVQIPQISSSGKKEVYVYNASNQRIGKLNVFVYPEKTKEVILVPIANIAIDSVLLQNQFSSTFKEANINIDFSIANQWNNNVFGANTSIELPADVGLLSSYSGQMKALREYYFTENPEAPQDVYYIFVVNDFDDPAVRGYMPRGKALGFVAATSSIYHDIAHELSHGIGALQHTWKLNGPDEGSTDNLLDYSNNSNLSETNDLIKSQWYELRDNDFLPNIWDDSQDAVVTAKTYTEGEAMLVNSGVSWTSAPSASDIFQIGEYAYVRFENSGEISEFGFENGLLKQLYIDSHVLVLQKTGYLLSQETSQGLQVASVKKSDRYNFICTHSSCAASRELGAVSYNGVPKQIIKEFADHDTRFGIEIIMADCESIEGDVITGFDHQNDLLIYNAPECPPLDPNSFSIPPEWFTDDLSVCFMTPDGKTFKMSPLGVRSLDFSLGLNEGDSLMPAGCLTSFKIKEDLSTDVLSTFEADYIDGEFNGYLRSDGAKYYNEIRTIAPTDFGIVMLPVVGGMGAFKYEASNPGYAYHDTLVSSNANVDVISLVNSPQAIKGYSIELLNTYGFAPHDVAEGTINDAFSSEMYGGAMTNHNEQYRLVVKILELRSQYPELFKHMSACDFGQWGCFLGSNIVNIGANVSASAVFSSSMDSTSTWGYYDYFYHHENYSAFNRTTQLQKFLKHFLDLIAFKRQQNQGTINSILDSQWCSEVIDGGSLSANHPDWSPEQIFGALETMSVDEIEQICMGTRMSLIGSLSFRNYVTDKYEKSIYRLIKHVDAAEQFELVEELCNREYDGTVLIKKIPEVVDDQVAFYGSGNYFTEILNQLITYYVAHPNQVNSMNLNELDSFQVLELRGRVVTYQYEGFVQRLMDQCGSGNAANFLSNISNVAITKQGEHWRVSFEDNLQACFISGATINSREFAIMEPLLISDEANLIEIYNNNSAPMGLPAFALYFIEEKANAKTTVEAIETAIDVTTLFVPGTQGKILFRVLNYADKASSIANMGANYSELDNPALAQVLALTSAITGFADISGSAVSKFKSLRSATGIQRSELAISLIDKSPSKLFLSHEAKVKEVLEKINNGTDPILLEVVANAEATEVVDELLQMEKAYAIKRGKASLANDIDDAIIKLNSLTNNSGGSAVTFFGQLNGNSATTLSATAQGALTNNLANQHLVQFDGFQYAIHTPSTFVNETGPNMYEMIVDNELYLKYNLDDGRLFMCDVNDGTYHAYVQEKNLFDPPSTGVDAAIEEHIIVQMDKLKAILGMSGNRTVNVLGEVETLDDIKTSTFIGRMDDINGLKSQLGDFKNVDLGEVAGGSNLLNRPDAFWSGFDNWWVNHNQPWMDRAINRVDDFYLSSDPSDFNYLFFTTDETGVTRLSVTAYELRELKTVDLKPKNIDNQEWQDLKDYIQTLEDDNLYSY
ncbi:MAG: hypothetical protein Crog4KO_26280 [Crocinitomicaceae bacterium]